MTYNDVLACDRCKKLVSKNNTKHFCETVDDQIDAWTCFGGYKREKSKGFWTE